jgi:hypothetical protein
MRIKFLFFLNKIKTKHVDLFEVEDKFFEKQLINFFNKNKIQFNFIKSPMFFIKSRRFQRVSANQ